MKKYISIKYLLVLSILGLIFTSCVDDKQWVADPAPTPPALTNGNADFSTYVAVGNSLTAGFTDGALFKVGQDNSIPNLVANKFANAGGGAFTIPYMNDNIGGLTLGGNVIQKSRLIFDGSGPVNLPATPTTELTPNPGPYNNMGVPGAKTFHLLANGYGNIAGVPVGLANPYFARMASTPNASVLEDAMAMNASFFTLWIGANDVLAYALNGGDGVDQTGNLDPTTYGASDITDPNVFANVYNGIVGGLTANGAKGAVLNLPYVNSLPFFTTVPYNPLSPDNADFVAQIPLLNGFYGQINPAFDALGFPDRKVTFSATAANPVVIYDENLTNISTQLTAALMAGGLDAGTAYVLGQQFGQSRQATAADLLTLSSKAVIGKLDGDHKNYLMTLGVPEAEATQLSMGGLTYPLVDKWVLLTSEQNAITTATDAYNTTIQNIATANGLAFVDVNTIMQDLASGSIQFDEFTMTNQYLFGNTFSLDGIHPTARGNAFIANKILMAIDATYGSNFKDSGNLNKAVDFPTLYPANL